MKNKDTTKNTPRAITDLDWDDPEAQLLRSEEPEEEEEEEEETSKDSGVFQRLDELLADFTSQERRMFWLVFVDGTSLAAAARAAEVGGNIYAKFDKMMNAMKNQL